MRSTRIRRGFVCIAVALTAAASGLAAAPSGASSPWSSPGAGVAPPVRVTRSNRALSPHASAGSCSGSLCQFYAAMFTMGGTSTGITALLNQARPKVAPGERSSAMISIGTIDGQQAVLFGWTVSKSLYHDTLPHFATNAVVDDTPRCLNDCGFVQVTKSPPKIAPGKIGKYTIKLSKARWELVYNGATIGYYPTSLWSRNRLTRNYQGQAFGTVSSPSATTPRSDMGNGRLGSTKGSAKIVGVELLHAKSMSTYHYQATDAPTKYDIGFTNVACHNKCSMNYGGPGF